MKDLHLYIKKLLTSYDCIIIPDFGALIATYNPAKLDGPSPSTPSKDLHFNRQLSRNDGLLINAIIEDTDIEYNTAKEQIATFVDETKIALLKGESVTLENIGTFTQDDAGFIHFTPDPHNETWLNSYGLNPVELSKITNRSFLTQMTKMTIPPKYLRLIYIITPAIALVVLIIIFATPLSKHSLIDYAKVDEPTPIETIDTIAQLPKEDIDTTSLPLSRKTPSEEITPEGSTDETEEILPKEKKTHYYIIIASLPSETLAKQHLVKFEAQYDFNSLKIVESAGRYRISISDFSRLGEADAFLSSFRLVNPALKDAWLLKETLE